MTTAYRAPALDVVVVPDFAGPQARAFESDEAWGQLARSDQVGLATAVAWLTRRGVPFARPPDHYNVRAAHLYRLHVERALRPPTESRSCSRTS